ncbi:MAG: hypothetical protein NT068_04070 [Candidatus Nomurabacteria bacterium]|nr:hypothetical protein [Candidatus Nomurabacteria bacterium]
MLSKIFTKTNKTDSEFSKFIREASSREKKKVFMEVLEKATEDQRKILNKTSTKTA